MLINKQDRSESMDLKAAELHNVDPTFEIWSMMEDEELMDEAGLDISGAEERGGMIPRKQTGGIKRNNARRYDSLEAGRSSVEFRVEMSSKCREEYAKIRKRGNPELLEQIDKILEELKTNPELGKRLKEDLKGERSIRIDRFRFRVRYKIKKSPSPVVVILSIGPRGSVYDEQTRYNSPQKSTPP